LKIEQVVEMDAAYQEIAEYLNEACPAEYTKSIIDAAVGDDYSEQEVWCEGPFGKKQPDISAAKSFQIGRQLRTIRSQMTIPGQKPWTRCTFTLFPDGKFKFDVEYDD
jgi:hypothetical protein